MSPSEVYSTEIARLREVAEEYLSDPSIIPGAQSRRRWRWVLLVWEYPSFNLHRSWAVYMRKDEASMRQVTWNQLGDLERFSDPIKGLREGVRSGPSIEVRDRPLELARLDATLRELNSIALPPFRQHESVMLDGVRFGVALPEAGARSAWNGTGPASWSVLTAWATKTRSWLSGVAAVPQPVAPGT